MRSILLAAALLTTSLASATALAASGDAGTGQDAGDTIETALTVPFGTYEGSVAGTDREDVYTLVLPRNTGVRITLTPLTGELYARTLHPEGYVTTNTPIISSSYELRDVAYGGTVHLSILQYESATYRVTFAPMAFRDLAVRSVEVDDIDPLGLLREVRVDLENDGAGYSRFHQDHLRVSAIHADGSVRVIGHDARFQLAPAEVRTFTFRWETVGQVGGVRIVAEAVSDLDEDPADNALGIAAEVLAPVEGTDALNQDRQLDVGDAEIRLVWRTFFFHPGATYYVRVDSPLVHAEAQPLSGSFGSRFLDTQWEEARTAAAKLHGDLECYVSSTPEECE